MRSVSRSDSRHTANFEESYPDFSPFHAEIIKSVRAYTMTSPERLYALIDAISYIVKNNVEGAIVECGVWRGGGMMAVMKTLLSLGIEDREVYLYDTFEEGMTSPDPDKDISWAGDEAGNVVRRWETSNEYPTLGEVKDNVYSTGYPPDNIYFIKGDVMHTLLNKTPKSISLLRLDTDWCQTTKFELEKLYPQLSQNGILIIDDYGHWKGARQAVDEYFAENNVRMFLSRVDYTCRLGVKH